MYVTEVVSLAPQIMICNFKKIASDLYKLEQEEAWETKVLCIIYLQYYLARVFLFVLVFLTRKKKTHLRI